MKKLLYLFLVIILVNSFEVYSKEKSKAKNAKVIDMKIRLIFNGTELTATMYDNPTARDFISLLPLTLELKDYNGTEKISYPPRKLSLKDAPSGSDPSIGDITYYSPWGNLAIFYRDFSYSDGLIKLGRIDSNVSYLDNWKGSKTVKIEVINLNNE
jgi:hypothetical protein